MILALSSILSVVLIFIFGNNYRRADRNLNAWAFYQRALYAANRLSAERGPTNGVLGEEPSVESSSHKRLLVFRHISDASLDALDSDNWGRGVHDAPSVDLSLLKAVRSRLAEARASVDRLAALPRTARSGPEIDEAIHEMFDVIDTLRPLVSTVISEIAAQDQSLAGLGLMGGILGDLREYVGRISAYLMTSIATHQPLSAATLNEVNLARGRIIELWQLAEDQAGFYPGDPRLTTARHDINTIYFGSGLPLVDKMIVEGRQSGDYSLTTAELTDRYVPTFAPIERLRTAFLDLTVEQSKALRDKALQSLIAVSVITGLIVVAQFIIIISARRLVFRPLLIACDHIIGLSEGHDIEGPSCCKGSHEMRRLFEALSVLRNQLRERLQLTERLRALAEKDSLTGLFNRSTFDKLGQDAAEFKHLPHSIGLILIDLDHFKAINDTYGHPVGDQVLRAAAALIRANLRESDIPTRYGGEELAIVIPNGVPGDVMALAERIRLALERTRFETDAACHIGVTASFGVAVGRRGGSDWTKVVHDADRALYRAKAAGRNQVVGTCEASPQSHQRGWARRDPRSVPMPARTVG